MEKFPGQEHEEKEEEEREQEQPYGLFSCWARLKRAFPSWRKLRCLQGNSNRRRRRRHMPTLRGVVAAAASCSSSRSSLRRMKPGDFRYDPLSYAQNFDESCWDEEDEASYRGFSSRFVVITPSPNKAKTKRPEEEEGHREDYTPLLTTAAPTSGLSYK